MSPNARIAAQIVNASIAHIPIASSKNSVYTCEITANPPFTMLLHALKRNTEARRGIIAIGALLLS